eukprot:2246510-Pyramimonas_sp.AAC.1
MMVLANSVLTGVGVHATKKYVTERMMIPLSEFPEKLTDALDADAESAAAVAPGAAASASSAASSAVSFGGGGAGPAPAGLAKPPSAVKAPRLPSFAAAA